MKRKKQLKIIPKLLGREKAYGQYTNDGVIEYDPRLSPRETLSTIIHELLHHLLPEASEQEVLRIEKVMARELWKFGARLIVI